MARAKVTTSQVPYRPRLAERQVRLLIRERPSLHPDKVIEHGHLVRWADPSAPECCLGDRVVDTGKIGFRLRWEKRPGRKLWLVRTGARMPPFPAMVLLGDWLRPGAWRLLVIHHRIFTEERARRLASWRFADLARAGRC